MLQKLKKMLNIREKKSYGAYSLLNGPWGAWGWDSQVTGWKYDRYAWLGYMMNPIAYRAVNIIADSVAGIPWKLYRKMADNRDVEIETAPVLNLLKRPNPWISEKDFFAQFVQYLQLSGNTYVRSAGPNVGAPKELYLLRPDRIEIRNATCGIGGICPDEYDSLIYEYTCGNAKEIIDLRHFHHTRLWNPLCDLYGLSPLQPASSSIDQLNESLQWNVSLLKNSASPSGVLSSDGNLSDEQIARLKEQMELKHQGVWNSGKPILLEGGLKFSPMGMSPKDMDWLEGTRQAMNNICIALGLDPSLIGSLAHRNHSTFRDTERSFYINTVIPILEKIRDDFLNSWLLPRFNMGDNVYFQYDIEAIEVLSDSRNDIFERMISGVAAGIITVNEAREELGYSELDNPEDDTTRDDTEEYIDIEERPDEG